MDKGEYNRGVEENEFGILYRLVIHKGQSPLTTLGLKSKLEYEWRLQKFKIIPIAKGYYHIFTNSMANQSTIMSLGPINLNPGVFRVSRWIKDFNTWKQHQTNAQVWIIHKLSIEY